MAENFSLNEKDRANIISDKASDPTRGSGQLRRNEYSGMQWACFVANHTTD